MTGKICISATTFKKTAALRNWLESIRNFGQVGFVHIADDNDGEAQPIAEEFSKCHEEGSYPFPVAYSTGPNAGIAKNKNRGIKFFMEAPEVSDLDYLVLSDDDIQFQTSEVGEKYLGDLILKAMEATGLRHVTGFLGGSFGKVNPDGSITGMSDPFFTQFKPIAENEYVRHCLGSQGILLCFRRDLLKQAGYFDTDWKSNYGYEHSLFSARVNRLEGRNPELFAILKNCNRYFHCQGIANNYSADPLPNAPVYAKRVVEVYNGVGLVKRQPGV